MSNLLFVIGCLETIENTRVFLTYEVSALFPLNSQHISLHNSMIGKFSAVKFEP